MNPSCEVRRGRLCRQAITVGNVETVIASLARRRGRRHAVVGHLGFRILRLFLLFLIQGNSLSHIGIGGIDHLGIRDAIDIIAVLTSGTAEESRIAVCAVLVVRAVGDDHIAVGRWQRRVNLVVKVADGEFWICPSAMAHIVAPENDQTRSHFRTVHSRTEHGCEVVAIVAIVSVCSHKQGHTLYLDSTLCRVVLLAARCQYRAMAANKDGSQHP